MTGSIIPTETASERSSTGGILQTALRPDSEESGIAPCDPRDSGKAGASRRQHLPVPTPERLACLGLNGGVGPSTFRVMAYVRDQFNFSRGIDYRK